MVQRKLSDDAIEVILRRRDAGESWKDLAEEYGMSSGESLRVTVNRRKRSSPSKEAPKATRPRPPKPRPTMPPGMNVGITSEALLRRIEELEQQVVALTARVADRPKPASGNQYKGAVRRPQVLGALSATEYRNVDQIIQKVYEDEGERITPSMVRNVLSVAEGVVKITRRERRGQRNIPVMYARLDS